MGKHDDIHKDTSQVEPAKRTKRTTRTKCKERAKIEEPSEDSDTTTLSVDSTPLGEGSYSQVLMAKADGIKYVVKKKLEPDTMPMNAFSREIDYALELARRDIAPEIFAVDLNRRMLITEHMTTLTDWLNEPSNIQYQAAAARLCSEMLHAIAKLGIIHLDIKPCNLGVRFGAASGVASSGVASSGVASSGVASSGVASSGEAASGAPVKIMLIDAGIESVVFHTLGDVGRLLCISEVADVSIFSMLLVCYTHCKTYFATCKQFIRTLLDLFKQTTSRKVCSALEASDVVYEYCTEKGAVEPTTIQAALCVYIVEYGKFKGEASAKVYIKRMAQTACSREETAPLKAKKHIAPKSLHDIATSIEGTQVLRVGKRFRRTSPL
jgi:hypothetical protein